MKVTDVQAGRFYHDGKQGVREVLTIEQDQVRYRMLAAKQTQAYDHRQKTMVPLLNTESSMTLGAFAAWAKTSHVRETIDAVLLDLQARALKLSPGELAFLQPALSGAFGPGATLAVSHTDGRAVAGLAKKGLVTREGAVATLTVLGGAWVRTARVARATSD